MAAWICEQESLYSLDVNRKGYSSLYALPRLRMNQQPLVTALPMRLAVIASEARQSTVVSAAFVQVGTIRQYGEPVLRIILGRQAPYSRMSFSVKSIFLFH